MRLAVLRAWRTDSPISLEICKALRRTVSGEVDSDTRASKRAAVIAEKHHGSQSRRKSHISKSVSAVATSSSSKASESLK
jgi:hypothetical protein